MLSSRPKYSLLTWALAFSPALIPLYLILTCGVDFPFYDQWDPDLAGFFLSARHGHFDFAQLVAQHNEHRLVVPKLLGLPLDLITGYNQIAEMLFGWALACATSWIILILCRRSENLAYTPDPLPAPSPEIITADGTVTEPIVPPPPPEPRPLGLSTPLLWFVCNLLIFCPIQHENWLWGISPVNFSPVLGCVATIAVASCRRFAIRKRLLLALPIAFASTFASGNGFLAWVLAFPLLAWPDEGQTLGQSLKSRKGVLITWVIAFAITEGLYFLHYHKPPHAEGEHAYAATSAQIVNYFFLFLGGPFAFGTSTPPTTAAMWVGATLLALLVASIGYVGSTLRAKRDAPMAAASLTWLMIAGFAVLSGAMAAVFRAGMGLDQALASRYVTFSLYLPLALVNLVALGCAHLRLRHPGRRLWLQVPPFLMALVLIGSILSLAPAFETGRGTRMLRLQGKAALLLVNVLPENPQIKVRVYHTTPRLIDYAKQLNDLHYLHPPLIMTPRAAAIEAGPADTTTAAALGKLEQFGQSAPGHLAAVGWAAFPAKSAPADAVFLTYEDSTGAPIIFALADVGALRDDVARTHNNPDFRLSGWIAQFPASVLPANVQKTTITAWAFDTTTGRARRLEGGATVQR